MIDREFSEPGTGEVQSVHDALGISEETRREAEGMSPEQLARSMDAWFPAGVNGSREALLTAMIMGEDHGFPPNSKEILRAMRVAWFTRALRTLVHPNAEIIVREQENG